MPTGARSIYETGNEPDYTVDDIPKWEFLRDGMVRLYCGADWRDGIRIEYSVRCNKDRLADFARLLMLIAAGTPNSDALEDRPEAMH